VEFDRLVDRFVKAFGDIFAAQHGIGHGDQAAYDQLGRAVGAPAAAAAAMRPYAGRRDPCWTRGVVEENAE
jgi:hypothetical protein